MDRIWPLGRLKNGVLTQEKTWQVRRPFGQTLRLTLFALVCLTGIAEFITRADAFQTLLADPNMGSRHYQLGRKLARLDTMIEKEGPIDCLIIGSSMVDVGFDPSAFREGYEQTGNQGMRCFNFGIDASTAVSAAAIAQILVEDYQPRLLIYGTDARDYAVPSTDKDPAVVLQSNWIRYRLGHFSLDGWLLAHSYLYRYRHYLFLLSRLQLENALRSQTRLPYEMTSRGFTPQSTVSTYINDPPDPEDDSFEVTYNFSIFSSYQMLPENLAALEKIMSLSQGETQVIVVEMPVADGLSYFFGNGGADQQRFVQQIDTLANKHAIPFWPTNNLEMIPDDGWFDYSHLNTVGAAIFSHWLGQRVAEIDQ